MTAFEQGYEAFITGNKAEDNPFDPKNYPFTSKRWSEGWKSAQAKRAETAR